MANRDRHRQGLVYGPVRPTGPRDRGRIVGNLLGLLVVVMTVGVLAVAIYFFLQERAAPPVTPAQTPTPVASEAPLPSTGSSAQPSASQIALSSLPIDSLPPPPTSPLTAPPSVAEVTPGPTISVPPVMVGAGFITFGTIADDQLQIVDPKTTFGIDEPMVWSAHLTDAANSADLRIRFLILDPSQPSGQRLVREDEVKPDATDVAIFVRRLRPIGQSAGPGLYTIEYVRGDQVLATGSFLVQ